VPVGGIRERLVACFTAPLMRFMSRWRGSVTFNPQIAMRKAGQLEVEAARWAKCGYHFTAESKLRAAARIRASIGRGKADGQDKEHEVR